MRFLDSKETKVKIPRPLLRHRCNWKPKLAEILRPKQQRCPIFNEMGEQPSSAQDGFDNIAVNIGKTKIAARVTKGELLMVQP